MSSPATSMDYVLNMILISVFITYLWLGDLAYEIPSLEVYPPISLAVLSVSLPQHDTPKCLNVLTLIATLGIRISLFTESTEGCFIQIHGHPHLSNLESPV